MGTGGYMKEQINRFARGVFEYEPPVLETTESNIYAVVDKNRQFEGSITIFERNGKNLKGVIYSDNDKVILKEDTFAGDRTTIGYTVKCKGALNGDVIEGSFNIVSNGGEDKVPFSFRVEAGSHDTSEGTIRNLFHFANLARTNADEAISLMESEDFEDVYLDDSLPLRCVYEGIIKGRDSRNNLEEFLIAIHKKNRINISIAGNNRIFDSISENFRDTIQIERDTWGYSNVYVSCDSEFIRLERKEIDSDLFTGNRFDFSYIIEYDKLHKRKNYAEIIFETTCQKIVFSITINRTTPNEEEKNRRLIHKLDCDLMSSYIKFRTHALNMSEWIRETEIIIEAVRAVDDSNPFYRLALAQIYIASKKDTEAKWLIENVKDEITTDNPSDYPLYCYFIYINTLYNKDRAYSKRAAARVNEIFNENDDWRILWTLLFMDEDLEVNPSLRLLRIKEQFNKGCCSPALYVEACYILNDQPLLLRVLNSFEINVLNFGAKYKLLDKRLCLHVADMINNVRYGTENFISMMRKIYSIYDDEEILESLCKILIRNTCVGEKYLEYYRLGIEAELKITQLFEYYIASRNYQDMSPLPKMVIMYFGYNNNLDYAKKAYLYSNIIHNKADNPQAFKGYVPQMEEFVLEQLMSGHINEQLADLYKNLMNIRMITEENAGPVSEIYFTYRIECSNLDFHHVIIRHKESNSEKEYAINNGVAYVKIYTDDCAVFFESDSKNRYCSSVPYNMVRLLEDDKVMAQCILADPSLVHLKLCNCEKKLRYQKKNLETVMEVISMTKLPEINRFYKRRLNTDIVDYYYDSYDAEGFESFISTAAIDSLDEKEITKIIEIYIIQGEYDKAYELIEQYSYTQVIPKRLMKLCSRLIISGKYDESVLLLNICHFVFSKGRYDEHILAFLVDRYNGTTKDMVEVWKRASEFDIDTYDLEERLIAQMLFSHSYTELMTDVFDDYYSKGSKDRIVEAYLAYHSYLYFVQDKVIPEELFTIMEASFENEKELALVCGMALVKYYSELDDLSEYQKNLAKGIITGLTRKDYVFPFYSKFTGVVDIPFEIMDKTMVEYRTSPKSRVIIHYMYEDSNHKKKYVAEDMNNVYEGIYVKQFILFYGEVLSYYVSEEKDGKETITESHKLVNTNVRPDKSEGRYDAINDILASHDLHDGQTMQKLIHTYAVTEYVAGQMFRPL